ncbi:uncharacterized protein J3D65DRAFT_676951 [Phyllosticta citribraziliensis]|uniref:Uncharacterized protein n=1 Tax=Phyllosticta citribraziliensis TaxID=989973 RepID=A0ABR1LNZ1_9PEZI
MHRQPGNRAGLTVGSLSQQLCAFVLDRHILRPSALLNFQLFGNILSGDCYVLPSTQASTQGILQQPPLNHLNPSFQAKRIISVAIDIHAFGSMDAAQQKLAELRKRKCQVREKITAAKAEMIKHQELIAKLEKDANEKEAEVKNLEEANDKTKNEAYYQNPDYLDYAILCHAKTNVDMLKAWCEELSEEYDGKTRKQQYWKSHIASIIKIREVDTDAEGNTPKELHQRILQELDQLEKNMAEDGVSLPVRLGYPKPEDVISKP